MIMGIILIIVSAAILGYCIYTVIQVLKRFKECKPENRNELLRECGQTYIILGCMLLTLSFVLTLYLGNL